jgi:glycosyltransferase involved in cell wall biosynthesis
MGTWNKQVDAYLCLTEMARQKFIEHGLPEEKLYVKPNFIDNRTAPNTQKEDFLVYAGRVMENKGAKLILELAKKTKHSIKIIGDGDMIEEFNGIPNVELLGRKTHDETVQILSKAKAILFPTMLYEGMPMTIIEGFSLKIPIIATNIGASKSMIKNNVTGLLFEMGNYDEFYNKVEVCFTQPKLVQDIVNNAFNEYKRHYTAESNYKMLMEIYSDVLN